MLPWILEEWITEAGDVVVRKHIDDETPLAPHENLLYEIWLLDTEARNGGLSQYFCNHGIEQWRICVAAANAMNLIAFRPFEAAVTELISGALDPYDAIISAGDAADNIWYAHHRGSVISELYEMCRDAL